MREENVRPGMEAYLYKDMKCCLHPCDVKECPEVQCALDFPGGLTVYLRYQEVRKIFAECRDIDEAAKILGVDRSNAYRRWNWYKSISEKLICQ